MAPRARAWARARARGRPDEGDHASDGNLQELAARGHHDAARGHHTRVLERHERERQREVRRAERQRVLRPDHHAALLLGRKPHPRRERLHAQHPLLPRVQDHRVRAPPPPCRGPAPLSPPRPAPAPWAPRGRRGPGAAPIAAAVLRPWARHSHLPDSRGAASELGVRLDITATCGGGAHLLLQPPRSVESL
jgi:hypothetical protein